MPHLIILHMANNSKGICWRDDWAPFICTWGGLDDVIRLLDRINGY